SCRRAYGSSPPQGGWTWRDPLDSQRARCWVHSSRDVVVFRCPGTDRPPLTFQWTDRTAEIQMRQLQFMQSNTFRWASAVGGVFAVFIIAVFGFIYLKIDDYLVARTDRMIAIQSDYIAALPPERRL